MRYLDFTKGFAMWKTYKKGLEEKKKSLYLEDLMNKDFEIMQRYMKRSIKKPLFN